MKKITFILFALIAGTAYTQNTKTATAPVNAEIVSPIGITLDSGTKMDFGKFTTSASDATIILAADGSARTFSETDMELSVYTSYDVPVFTVTKDASALYTVALNIVSDPGAEMTLSNLTHTLGTDAGNDETSFRVGGTLTVPSTAAAGAQNGQISVTVTYE